MINIGLERLPHCQRPKVDLKLSILQNGAFQGSMDPQWTDSWLSEYQEISKICGEK